MTDIAVTPSDKKKFIDIKVTTCYGKEEIQTVTINLYDIVSLREDKPDEEKTILRQVNTLFDSLYVYEKEFKRIKKLLLELNEGGDDADSKSGQVGFK